MQKVTLRLYSVRVDKSRLSSASAVQGLIINRGSGQQTVCVRHTETNIRIREEGRGKEGEGGWGARVRAQRGS